jgi:hypothetical protein
MKQKTKYGLLALVAVILTAFSIAHVVEYNTFDGLLENLFAGSAMLMSGVYSCENVPPYEVDSCLFENGKIRHAGWYKSSYTWVDPTDPTEWASAIASGDVELFPNVYGTKDKGDMQTMTGFGDLAITNTGKTFKAKFFAREAVPNVEYWNAMNYTSDRVFFYVTENYVWFAGVPCTFHGGEPVEEAETSMVKTDVDVAWSSKDNPLPYEKPTGIFPNA